MEFTKYTRSNKIVRSVTFEMSPIGNTRAAIKEHGVIEEDAVRKSNAVLIKEVSDNFIREFLNDDKLEKYDWVEWEDLCLLIDDKPAFDAKAEKMKELVEAFYDLSVLEEQQTVPSKETFNFSNMLIDLITEHAPALEKKNIIPEIKLPDYSIYIYSDRNMVERILQNLLTNAMKYSAGNIKITLMQKSDGGIRFMMENPVSDSLQIDGNRLFDRFYTGDTSRHDGSTGVGLAVVKALVLALDGNVGASVQDNNLKIILEL